MATVIKLKRGTTTPTTGDITSGEVAVDTSAQKLYINDSGSIKEIGRDVVNDLSPQLGGNLDLNSSDITGTGNINITGTATLSGNLTVDTNTLYVDSSNNRVGIGTTSPAYQVEIENTGANALLVLDRTDGAGCFIEGQATRSAFGSVGATPLALAYNSAAVVTIGASGAITVNPDGANPFTFPTTDGSANQVLQTDGSGTLSFATVSSGGNSFSTISVSGQSDVVADSSTDTLTIEQSGLIAVTTNAGTDTVTIGTPSSAAIPFLKSDGSSSNIELQTSGTIGEILTNLFIPFIKSDGSSVETLVVGTA